MIFRETELSGAFIIEVERVEDERGFFARAWCQKEMAEQGLETRVAQCDISFNAHRGTLRGLHFQRPPHEEVKIVSCPRGAIYDVIVDIREDSPTFRHWIGLELTQQNRRMLYVPRGLAHGFQVLSDDTEVFYMMSEFYAPGFGDGVRWNDPSLGIEWPLEPTEISDKDRNLPDFSR